MTTNLLINYYKVFY